MSLVPLRIQFQNMPYMVQIVNFLSDWDNLVDHGFMSLSPIHLLWP